MKPNSGVNLDDVGDNMVTINDILELRPSWWKYKLTNALERNLEKRIDKEESRSTSMTISIN